MCNYTSPHKMLSLHTLFFAQLVRSDVYTQIIQDVHFTLKVKLEGGKCTWDVLITCRS